MSQDYKIVHGCIRVLDLEESIEFYEDALNFEVTRRSDYPEDEFTLVFLKGPDSDFEIELTYNYDREEPYEIGDGFSHFAVVVDDIEEAHQEHKESGYEVTDIYTVGDEADGGLYFITDPDGYEVEIIQK